MLKAFPKPAKMAEAAQRIMEIDIEDGEKVLQCVNCGAFVVVKKA